MFELRAVLKLLDLIPRDTKRCRFQARLKTSACDEVLSREAFVLAEDILVGRVSGLRKLL